MPEFRWVSGSADVTVTVGSHGTVCGHTPSKNSILLESFAGSNCTNGSDIRTTLVHEFGHVLGFSSSWHQNDLPSADCAMHLPVDSTINGQPCAQEVEFLFAVYGFSNVAYPTMWGRPAVTGVQLARTVMTLEVGAAQPDSVTGVRVDYPDVEPQVLAPSSASYQWNLAPDGIASISSETGRVSTITGMQPGSTTVRVTVSGTSVPDAYVGALARLMGQGISVTVNSGPAPPPAGTYFRVSDITGPPVPITEAGVEGLHAVVEDPYSEFFQVKWDISYSNGSHAAIHTDYYPSPNYALPVPAGSYKITVTATARSEGHYKSHTSYFPVCTGSGGGGGGLPLRMALPDSLGGPVVGPDAVGGC